ncbi:hypothetical protein V6N12_015942 [Hibiscus sabdariffa]|uniref:Uncharacterized protein n=1 Tax=Hibiscus sabdariffa TaxID=183260 RepID=A0ABR2DPP2_9ROSI
MKDEVKDFTKDIVERILGALFDNQEAECQLPSTKAHDLVKVMSSVTARRPVTETHEPYASEIVQEEEEPELEIEGERRPRVPFSSGLVRLGIGNFTQRTIKVKEKKEITVKISHP